MPEYTECEFYGACDDVREELDAANAEIKRLRTALKAVTEFAAEYAGGVNSDIGNVEEWEPMKQARAALGE